MSVWDSPNKKYTKESLSSFYTGSKHSICKEGTPLCTGSLGLNVMFPSCQVAEVLALQPRESFINLGPCQQSSLQ